MPIQHFNVVASGATGATKQTPRQLQTLLTLFVLFFSACSTQTTAASLPNVPPESFPIKASIQAITPTPAPAGVAYVGDSVPAALRKQFEGKPVRLDISTTLAPNPQSKRM